MPRRPLGRPAHAVSSRLQYRVAGHVELTSRKCPPRRWRERRVADVDADPVERQPRTSDAIVEAGGLPGTQIGDT